ncbi:MAG: DivIVA domain-containing protein [Actinomycetota bacterium]|nr:DivIVA domain-containing protein [Actinomycetota bacterium]
MELTPIDVQQKTFRASLRGYAEDEVDDFLDQVVETLRGYQQRLQQAEERTAALEEQLSTNEETEAAIKRTFIAAQRTHDEMVEEARAEAARILAEAKEEADNQLAEVRMRAVRAEESHVRERDQLMMELVELRRVTSDLRGRLEALAAGALEDLRAVETSIAEAGAPALTEGEPYEEDRARQEGVGEQAAQGEEPIGEERAEGEEHSLEEEPPREASMVGNVGRAAYLRRPRTRRPWERDEE